MIPKQKQPKWMGQNVIVLFSSFKREKNIFVISKRKVIFHKTLCNMKMKNFLHTHIYIYIILLLGLSTMRRMTMANTLNNKNLIN